MQAKDDSERAGHALVNEELASGCLGVLVGGGGGGIRWSCVAHTKPLGLSELMTFELC